MRIAGNGPDAYRLTLEEIADIPIALVVTNERAANARGKVVAEQINRRATDPSACIG
jgi:hypothetical protein